MRSVEFGACFSRCQREKLVALMPAMYAALDTLAPWRKGVWPRRILCMSDAKIFEGRARGAGHGMTYVPATRKGVIYMNPHMTTYGLYLVLIHENLHHAFPDATETELNNVHVPRIYEMSTGRKFDKARARKAGLGPPQPGIGDRGYVR